MQATECTSCAIMQPYFFPYLAYFQLVDAVNTFVIYDDVNYINGGWIHRNNILSHGGSQRIVLNLSGSSQNKLINEIEIFGESKKILKTISQNYSKAPNFEATFSFFENLISKANGNLATYLEYGIREICRTLGIDSKIIKSSDLKDDKSLKGQDRIISICEELNCTHYVNAIGGRSLYRNENFTERGKSLGFLQTRLIEYGQFTKPFTPNLSIIDMMMFNTPEDCRSLLKEYDLV